MNFEPQFPRPNKEFNPKKEPEIFIQQNKKDFLSLAQKISSIILNILMILLFFGLINQMKNNKNLFSNDHSNTQWALDKKVQNNKLTIDKDFCGSDSIKKDIKDLIENIENTNENIPRGFLLHGPPGTGKTYLAKCLAGSVKKHAPFFIVNGSDLVEKYVGLGALRIRTLFETAKKEANTENKKYFFIFIDEIDSIGRKRSSDGNAGNIEAENTLNALLGEIDGFKSNNEPYGIVFGSTNREELLDDALVREGRLGKKIYLGHPNKKEIKKLIEFFLNKNKILKTTIDKILKDDQGLLETLSSALLTTSDINSLIKEAIKLAPDKKDVKIEHLYDAFDAIQMGVQSEQEQCDTDKDTIIQHELGHALVAKALGSEVNRINVESKGKIGGYTLSSLKNETILPTQNDLIERIIILLGGRAAEAIFRQNNISSGSSNDLIKVKSLANHMVQDLGMCFKLKDGEIITEDIASNNDKIEIKNIIDNSYEIAKHIMKKYKEKEYRNTFQNLKDELKKEKKINKTELNEEKYKYYILEKGDELKGGQIQDKFKKILDKKS